MALSQWSDAAFFQPGAGLSMGTNTELPEDILQDRREFFNFMDFSTLQQQLPHLFSQFRSHLQLVETMLADHRRFLLGDAPGWADILAYFPLWMCRGNIAGADSLVQSLPALLSWEKRMQAIGHGQPSPMQAQEALDVARAAPVNATASIADDAWPSLAVDTAVTVTPQDYGAVPVAGKLLRLTHEEIAILREDPQVGAVAVHFPRIGYRVEASI